MMALTTIIWILNVALFYTGASIILNELDNHRNIEQVDCEQTQLVYYKNVYYLELLCDYKSGKHSFSEKTNDPELRELCVNNGVNTNCDISHTQMVIGVVMILLSIIILPTVLRRQNNKYQKVSME